MQRGVEVKKFRREKFIILIEIKKQNYMYLCKEK